MAKPDQSKPAVETGPAIPVWALAGFLDSATTGKAADAAVTVVRGGPNLRQRRRHHRAIHIRWHVRSHHRAMRHDEAIPGSPFGSVRWRQRRRRALAMGIVAYSNEAWWMSP